MTFVLAGEQKLDLHPRRVSEVIMEAQLSGPNMFCKIVKSQCLCLSWYFDWRCYESMDYLSCF